MGNGYQVVNVFTEDHAALTGARKVVTSNSLRPERSYNANLNYQRLLPIRQSLTSFDASAFYTYFTNKITPNYASDPTLLIYDNLRGHAVLRGITLNADLTFGFPLAAILGVTALDVYQVNADANGQKQRQLFTERVSGFALSYRFAEAGLSVDYTGNVYGSMRLPLLGPLGPQPASSPAFTVQCSEHTGNQAAGRQAGSIRQRKTCSTSALPLRPLPAPSILSISR